MWLDGRPGAICGWSELEGRWRRERQSLLDAVHTSCWDEANGWLTDLPGSNTVSIHAQVQAALAGMWSHDNAAAVLERVLGNDNATQPGTLYYRAHLAEALRLSGRRDLVHDLYPRWFAMLDGTGIGTWLNQTISAAPIVTVGALRQTWNWSKRSWASCPILHMMAGGRRCWLQSWAP